MRSRTTLKVALCVCGLAVVIAFCAFSGAPSRACKRFRYWFVWGDVDFPPAAERARLELPLPADTGPIAVSGVLSYASGHRGVDREKGLALRHVEVEAGGITIRIEDARWSSLPGSRALAAEPGELLVASVRGMYDAGMVVPIDYRYYRFRPGEPVELQLPFVIIVTPVSDPGGGRFSVKLGELEIAGLRNYNELDKVWEPYFRADRRVRVDVAMVHWRKNTRYASVSLNEIDADAGGDAHHAEKNQWHLSLHGKQVLCEATSAGHAVNGRGS